MDPRARASPRRAAISARLPPVSPTMDHDPRRLLRLRWSEDLDLGARTYVPRAVGASSPAPRGTPRFLGRVVNGGAMPNQTGRVYLVNPVRLDGVESEGATASATVD